jgi:predicted amidohydrolase YtcJ
VDQYAANLLARMLAVGFLIAAQSARIAAQTVQLPTADTVVVHARIYTVDRQQPWAEALAIRAGKLVAVGSESSIDAWRGRTTRIIDAGGRLVLPGFTDSHIHFVEGALLLARAHLDGTHNIAEIQLVLRQYAAEHPAKDTASAWIVGHGWSYPEFGEAGMPDKKYLDQLFPDRPVLLESFDGHTYWVNSAALKLAAITRDTPDPLNGKIVRDSHGEPTGVLQESAADPVLKMLPQPSRTDVLRSLRVALAEANRVGLTRVISCGNDTPGASDDQWLDVFAALQRQHQLTLRFYVSTYADPAMSDAEIIREATTLRRQYPPGDPWLAVGAVKFFLDGVIEGHTAAMLAPYSDRPDESGRLRWDAARYKELVATLDHNGFQIFTHAIGDRAVRLALDAYEHAQHVNGTHDERDRIEHIETVSLNDIPRFGSLGVIASFQPLHAYSDADKLYIWLEAVGAERGARAWAWRSIAAHGAVLAFGSDWPVVTMDPWQGIQNALTRPTVDSGGGFVSGERITLEQAIAGYTIGGAMGGRRERGEGSLTVGKEADLIVVSQDLFTIDPHAIAQTKVLLTIVGGRIVYHAPEWGGLNEKKRG